MDRLQQADVGQGENIANSVQAAKYEPLDSQMNLGSKLMEQGFQGASQANIQGMQEQAMMDRLRAGYTREDVLAKQKEMETRQAHMGTLTQIMAEMDDVIDSADMNDPVVADRIGAIVRKRMQIEDLIKKGGSSAYLGGILKQGDASGMLSAQTQGEVGEMRGRAPKKEEETKKEGETKKEEKPKEQNHWSENPSSNEIN